MKLLYCLDCNDIVRLVKHRRACECGETQGVYEDDRNAIWTGPAIPMGIHNRDFVRAAQDRPQYGPGKEFRAWVMPLEVESFTEVEEVEDGSAVSTS